MNREQVESRLPALPRLVPVVIKKWPYSIAANTSSSGTVAKLVAESLMA